MKIAKTFVALLLLCVTVLTSSAQDKDQLTGSLLWKVSGNGLTEPSYILGTHHLIHLSFTDSISGFNEAMNNTRQVVGELIIFNKQNELQAEMAKAGLMPEGHSYSNLLSADDCIKLDESLKSFFGKGLDSFDKLHPAMISMLYTVMAYAKYYPDFNPASHEAIDQYVQRKANEENKPVLGLETAQDQIKALFETETLKVQAEDLVCLVSNEQNLKKITDSLNIFYRAGKLKEMYDFSFNNPEDPCPVSNKTKTAILKTRNDNWMKQLPQIMKDKPSLIVAGALHLAGEEGLLYQLSQMGYTVEPVK